jgi:hypothetical protein
MAQLPESFSRVTYEESRVQAATTEDLITKLGSNHSYLKNQYDNVLPANDAANQVKLDTIIGRDANIKVTLVGAFPNLAVSEDEVPVWMMEHTPGEGVWTAILASCYVDPMMKYRPETRFEIERNIPVGAKRCFLLGRMASGNVSVWRADVV